MADDPKALFKMLREAVKRENSGSSLSSLPPDPGILFSAIKQGDQYTVRRMCAENKWMVWILSPPPTTTTQPPSTYHPYAHHAYFEHTQL